MIAVDALRGMNVMFATPCYNRNTTSIYTSSIFNLGGACAALGLKCALDLYSESLIPRARNKMVAHFLSEDFTHLFFVDADLQFVPADVFRLLMSGHEVCAGVYPLKEHRWPETGIPANMTRTQFEDAYTMYPVRPVDGTVGPDGFMEVIEALTGFMCIQRSGIEKMMEKYPELQYVRNPIIDADPNIKDNAFWRFFDCMVDPETRNYLSEDFAFSYLWRKIGGKLWVDFESKLNHLGQHVFRGDLKAAVLAQGG